MQMETNIIGLDQIEARELATELNKLLADYQLFYQNLRGLHWNIKGDDFFELHLKYEEFYNDAQVKIDEIAERILTLGETPLHSFSAYLENSDLEVVTHTADGKAGVKATLNGFQKLIIRERKILELAGEYKDEGTLTQISDYISQTEKIIWMLNAYLKR